MNDNERAIDNALDRWRSLPPLSRARSTIARLYVDTSHDALDLVTIAEALLETQFDAATLDRMFREEITPVCQSYAPIGVWPDFDIDWLNQEIDAERSRQSSRGVLSFVRKKLQRKPDREAEALWQQILRYLEAPDRLREDAKRLRSEASR
jgi:hypothetical protein